MATGQGLEAFLEQQRQLLEIERATELETQAERLEHLSAKALEQRGVCIAKSAVTETRTTFGGRIIVTLGSANPNVELLPAHKLRTGDIVRLVSAGVDVTASDLCAVHGVVTQATEARLSVAVDDDGDGGGGGGDDSFHDLGTQIRVDKLANDVTYKRMKFALGLLEKGSYGHAQCIVDVCFGRSAPSGGESGATPERWFNDGLNASQREAVRFAVGARDVALIHGPPGTGKTTTLVETIRQLVAADPGVRVLACAPSNTAVDNLCLALAAAPELDVVRLGHPARLVPAVVAHSLDARLACSDAAGLVGDIRGEIDTLIRGLRTTKGRAERRAVWREVRALRKEARRRAAAGAQGLIQGAHVVLATNTGADTRALRGEQFDVVVIDECAQAVEATCWIPLLKGRRAILAGDHLQLPPTIVSDAAASQGLQKTLYERLMEMHGEAVSRMLTVQYRMHDAICSWASAAMYDGRLSSHASVAGHLLRDLPHAADDDPHDLLSHPMMMVDTTGEDMWEQEDESGSRRNRGEAHVAEALVRALLESGLQPGDIGVITPYNAQRRLLREMMADVVAQGLLVGTVDSFQGMEREAVVLTLVRSNDNGEIGFLKERRRLNVAVTRGRRLVCVVCDAETVGRDPFVETLVEAAGDVEYRSAAEWTGDGVEF